MLKITAFIKFDIASEIIMHEIYVDTLERFEYRLLISSNINYEGVWIFNYAAIDPRE